MSEQINPKEKIEKIKDDIFHLKEYLLSDCCKQCADIVAKIEQYQNEIQFLEKQYHHV